MDGGSLINDIPERGLFCMDQPMSSEELHICSVVAGSSTHLGPLSLPLPVDPSACWLGRLSLRACALSLHGSVRHLRILKLGCPGSSPHSLTTIGRRKTHILSLGLLVGTGRSCWRLVLTGVVRAFANGAGYEEEQAKNWYINGRCSRRFSWVSTFLI